MAFFLGQKPGGIQSVHKNFQLRFFKEVGVQVIAVIPVHPDVHPVFPQKAYIVIEAFAAGRNVHGGQLINETLDGESAAYICLKPEYLGQTEQFEFLPFTFRHGSIPLTAAEAVFCTAGSFYVSVYYIFGKLQDKECGKTYKFPIQA